MKALIETFINGNLTDARTKARRHSARKLREAFMEHAGYSFKKAQLAAEYLKTGTGFQEYCDAE